MDEPVWLDRSAVEVLHDALIREHGGSYGLRDAGLLESALARPRNRWAHDAEADLASIAGAYAFGIVKNHPFVDGNKRIGFACAGVFLLLNGLELTASEPEAVFVIRDIAAGELGEPELVAWLRQRSEPVD